VRAESLPSLWTASRFPLASRATAPLLMGTETGGSRTRGASLRGRPFFMAFLTMAFLWQLMATHGNGFSAI
jgi:hypothetical protein